MGAEELGGLKLIEELVSSRRATLEDDSDSDSAPPSLLSASSESGSDDDGADGGIWCHDDGVWYDDDSMPPLTDASDDSETEPDAEHEMGAMISAMLQWDEDVSEDDNLYFTLSMGHTSDVPPDLEDVDSSGPPSLVSASDDDSETTDRAHTRRDFAIVSKNAFALKLTAWLTPRIHIRYRVTCPRS